MFVPMSSPLVLAAASNKSTEVQEEEEEEGGGEEPGIDPTPPRKRKESGWHVIIN